MSHAFSMPGYEMFDGAERQAVVDLFDRNGGVLFAHGFESTRNGIYRVREFETALTDFFNFPHVQAVSSGSAALRIALESLGITAGDEVIMPAHTFIATAEAILQIGAVPVVVDVDESLNMSPVALSDAITPRTRAVVPVHMMGEMSDMSQIEKIARDANLLIVEDCAQALGTRHAGRYAGCFSDAAAFSTDAGKTLCTGEGGFISLTDSQAFSRARAMHDHGHAYCPDTPRGEDPAICVGFNYRMTEVQAAIGLVQLSKLERMQQLQRQNKEKIMTSLRSLPVEWRQTPIGSEESNDTIAMRLSDQATATRVANHLSDQGVATKNLPSAIRWHFAGCWPHLFSETAQRWSKSEDLLRRTVALGVNVIMTDEEIETLCMRVRCALDKVLP